MERRKEKRVNGAAVQRIAGRIRPGYAVVVINLSPSGALVEGARPLPPGRRVDVHLAEDELRILVRAQVIRCSVAALDADSITYRAGLVFEARLEMRDQQTPRIDRVVEEESSFVDASVECVAATRKTPFPVTGPRPENRGPI
jgi:hypothetical protein